MAKILLFFLASAFTSAFAQILKFDVMTTYAITKNNSNFEQSSYAMSSNTNYLMKILNNYDGSQTANVYDLKSLILHEYNVVEQKTANNEIEYKFVYIVSSTFSRSPVGRVYTNFETISNENDTETVKLVFHKNKSKTKPVWYIELKVLKSDVNLFSLFRFSCLHPFEFITDLNYSKPGLVLSGVSQDGNRKYQLKAIKETNLEIILPNKPIFKKTYKFEWKW